MRIVHGQELPRPLEAFNPFWLSEGRERESSAGSVGEISRGNGSKGTDGNRIRKRQIPQTLALALSFSWYKKPGCASRVLWEKVYEFRVG